MMKKSVSNILQSLIQTEQKFLSTEFLGPVFSNAKVRVLINGIITDFKINPPTFSGWGVFKSVNGATAELVRNAEFFEIDEYLEALPRHSLVVCRQTNEYLRCLLTNDGRLDISELVNVYLATECEPFDTITCRFDGSNFIFQSKDYSNIQNGEFLRDALNGGIKADYIHFPGLRKEEKIAYGLVCQLIHAERMADDEYRVRNALTKGGAEFSRLRKNKKEFVVEFLVDGERHISTVVPETLNVISAGICLRGQDGIFDLQSLPSVIREGQNRNRIYRVGRNR